MSVVTGTENRVVTLQDLETFKNQIFATIFSVGEIYWNSTIAYSANQVCFYNKMVYVCHTACTAGTLPTDTSYWYPLIA